MKYTYPITAIHIDGKTKLFYTRDEVLAFAKTIRRVYGQTKAWYDHHVMINPFWSTFHYSYKGAAEFQNVWVLRDDLGKIVSYSDFDITYDHRRKKKKYNVYRGEPVPNLRRGYRKLSKQTAKKNSGAGHRNRNRALAIYEAHAYGIKNNVGGRVIRWEGY